MKILIDLDDLTPMKGDLLEYDGHRWKPISHENALGEAEAKVRALIIKDEVLKAEMEDEIKSMRESIAAVAKAVKELI